jgi:2-polyprenyl-6-methoxyphenol hydroxylase-like FAD-dependent oxidoreductase
LTRGQVLDRYFLEHRAAVLDVAAFMDRLDRAQAADEPAAQEYRVDAIKRAIEVLQDGKGDRARRIQQVFSDPTTEPAESAKTLDPTNGAYHGGPSA